ncbi:hypothetical protein QCA50_005826 [Cerrena zonata]|uniref:F-box domain-containing protein n=1 Tax=Cerrena zonata TaxID=2478898 RepID=A0AAW0GE43_9APHY
MNNWTWMNYENHLESIMSQLVPVDTNLGPLLPIELCERVIDWIANDWDGLTLCACSLTCQAWLPRSRHRLYERIELKTWNILSRPAEAITYLPTRLQRLTATLRAHRILSGYVRRLTIDPSYPSMESFPDHQERDGISALCISLFFPRPLKNLRELHLGWMSLALTHAQFFRALALHKTVTTLSIVRISFAMGSQLARLIHCFPALVNLRVEGIDITFDDHNTLSPLPKSQHKIPPLSTLRFSGDSRHFESLLTLAIPKSIETVHSMYIECFGSAAVSMAVARCGASLIDLDLIIESHNTITSSFDTLDFRTNTNLEHLSLKGSHGITIAKLSSLYTILSTISSAALQRLSIELNFTEDDPKVSSTEVNSRKCLPTSDVHCS